MFKNLLKKYGTDFGILKQYFPKKSKNQLKVVFKFIQNKYKQIFVQEKKLMKE